MTQFSVVATGGTFDILHIGHVCLLSKSFEISDQVIIGLTSDNLAKKKGKIPINSYEKRLENLTSLISEKFPFSLFQISKLENDFGPAVLKEDVKALVVSDETHNQGKRLNYLRQQKNLSPLKIITVPMLLAKDGKRISTTRIKNHEIDIEGNLLSID